MRKEQNRVPEGLSESELDALLAESSGHTRHVVLLAADTGMRRSELHQLTFRDIDFEAGTITVRRSKNRDFRVIPMTDRVRQLLQALRQERGEGNDTTALPTRDIKRSLRSAALRANIDHVHLHVLRHTFAQRLRDRGVPLDRIMELMGHKSYAMVLRYAKARPQQLVDAIAALNPTTTIASQDSGCLSPGLQPTRDMTPLD